MTLEALQGDPDGEGYALDTTTSGVTLEAITPHGLYNGVQTIRQLLPAWITSSSVQPGPWTMPVVQIADYPRYAYRGLMLDIARHYESPVGCRAAHRPGRGIQDQHPASAPER